MPLSVVSAAVVADDRDDRGVGAGVEQEGRK